MTPGRRAGKFVDDMRARALKKQARAPGKDPIVRLRAICLALPDTTENHGAEHLAVWLPAPLGEQEALIARDPARFFRPPYVGQRGWVGVRIDGRPRWSQVAMLVEQAYRHVAPPPRARRGRASDG